MFKIFRGGGEGGGWGGAGSSEGWGWVKTKVVRRGEGV